jgi:hypothetical protein
MPNKSISTIQAGAPLTGATLLLVATGPVAVYSVEGYCGGSSGGQMYIQLLGTASPVSGTTIPLYSRQVNTAEGFSFVYDQNPLATANMNNGGSAATFGSNNLPVYAAISSTDGVWTSTATSTDCIIVIELPKIDPLNETVVGPSATVDTLTVFSDPNAALRITRFSVTNNSGATAYIMLFGLASPAAGASPVQQWTVANGSTLTESFGNEGYMPQQGDVNYVIHTGCYLYGSSTTQTLTATTGGQWTMTAWYNTNP